MKKNPVCPNCKSKNVIPIIYGYATEKTGKEEEKGNVKLGGCCTFGNEPEFHCKDCKKEW